MMQVEVCILRKKSTYLLIIANNIIPFQYKQINISSIKSIYRPIFI